LLAEKVNWQIDEKLKFWNKNCALADADVKESEKRLLFAQQEKIEIEGKNPEVEYLRDKEKFDREERERYEKELDEWKNRGGFIKRNLAKCLFILILLYGVKVLMVILILIPGQAGLIVVEGMKRKLRKD
jgi:hypothetical protein